MQPAASAKSLSLVVSNRYALVISSFNLVCAGEKDKAWAVLEQLPPDASDDAVCLFAKAAVASKKGLFKDASDYCLKVVALAPQFAWGYRTLGFLEQVCLGDPIDAENAYEKALQAEPELDAARQILIEMRVSRHDFDGAIDLAKSKILLDPHDAASYYALADNIYIKQWRFREAVETLDKAIESDPENAKYYRAKAHVMRLQGDLPGALIAQGMAVKFGADKAFELTELAHLEQLSNLSDKAIGDLKQAIKLDPGSQSAREMLISLLEQLHRYDELVLEYSEYLKTSPKDAKSHFQLAMAFVALGQIEAAQKEFVEAANLNPMDPEPHRQMGALKIKAHEYRAAAKEFTRALNINPSSVPDLVSLAYCYSKDEDYMQAEAAYVTALALQQLLGQSVDGGTDRLAIMRELAQLLLQETRYSDASNQLDSVIAMGKTAQMCKLDLFLQSRARALRDLSLSSALKLQTSFNNLDKAAQIEEGLAYVDTLLTAKRAELATELINSHLTDSDDTDKHRSWLLAVGRFQLATKNIEAGRQLLSKLAKNTDIDNALRSQALTTLAEQSLAAGNLSYAGTELLEARDLDAKNFNATVLAGRLALARKDSKLAISFAKKALELNPYLSQAYVLMGQAQLLQGEVKGALSSFRRACELYPALIVARKQLTNALSQLKLNAEAKKEEDITRSLEAQER
jgi:tetratricopeptide (TPR) repeat protein